MALEIKKVLEAIDTRDHKFLETLSPEDRKTVSPYVLMRYISNVNGNPELQEWFVSMTNELVNKDHWIISKNHKELLWKLLSSCGIGVKQFHPYLKSGGKKSPVKIEKLLAELYPAAKLSDIELQASLMTKQDKEDLFDKMGFDKKQRKEYE